MNYVYIWQTILVEPPNSCKELGGSTRIVCQISIILLPPLFCNDDRVVVVGLWAACDVTPQPTLPPHQYNHLLHHEFLAASNLQQPHKGISNSNLKADRKQTIKAYLFPCKMKLCGFKRHGLYIKTSSNCGNVVFNNDSSFVIINWHRLRKHIRKPI